MFFVVLKPDKTPAGIYASMKEAQDWVADFEPDIIAQGYYQIHPVGNARDAEVAGVKLEWKLTLEKFDGETGELLETVEREGVN